MTREVLEETYHRVFHPNKKNTLESTKLSSHRIFYPSVSHFLTLLTPSGVRPGPSNLNGRYRKIN